MDIFLNGNFTEKERSELSNKILLPVLEYHTKSIDPQEIVRFIFRDFNALSFMRDGVLSAVIAKTISKACSWVKTKKKSAKIQLRLELMETKGDKIFSLNIIVPTDNQGSFFLMLKKEFTPDFIEEIQDKEILSIGRDNEDLSRLEIIRIR